MAEDPDKKAERLRIEILTNMTPQQKADLVSQLTLAVQQLAFAGLRQADPAATDDEIWLRLAARRLGPDVIRKVYGVDVDVK